MISSCMGKSIREAASDLWDTLVLSARSDGASAQQLRRRREWGDFSEYEMDYRRAGAS